MADFLENEAAEAENLEPVSEVTPEETAETAETEVVTPARPPIKSVKQKADTEPKWYVVHIPDMRTRLRQISRKPLRIVNLKT